MSTLNLIQNEKLFRSRSFRQLARVLILYTFSLIFKSFDLTFKDINESTFRSVWFSLFYILFGLAAWAGASQIARKTERVYRKQSPTFVLIALCILLLLYGVIVSFLFGFFYAEADILLFHRYEAWESFSRISYELNFGTFLFYIMLLTFNGIIFYYKAWKEYQLQTERLMRENIQAKYDALRNQIDPHFFFNALSVLTNLVYKSADLSAEYITQMARIYRYILDKKPDNLVSIQSELDFLESYIFLMQIRHQKGIQVHINIDETTRISGKIPSVTLQMLVENAIKHTRFSAAEPLNIHIVHSNGWLVVSNEYRCKSTPAASAGIGLENIRKRYELITAAPVECLQKADQFIIRIPVITAS